MRWRIRGCGHKHRLRMIWMMGSSVGLPLALYRAKDA